MRTWGLLIAALGVIAFVWLMREEQTVIDVPVLEASPPPVVVTGGGELVVEAAPEALELPRDTGTRAGVYRVVWACTPAGDVFGEVIVEGEKPRPFTVKTGAKEVDLGRELSDGAVLNVPHSSWSAAILTDSGETVIFLEPKNRSRGIVTSQTGEALSRVDFALETLGEGGMGLPTVEFAVDLESTGVFDLGGWQLYQKPGKARLHVSAQGYIPSSSGWYDVAADGSFLMDSLVFALERPTLWSGTVTAAGDGRTVEGALVHVVSGMSDGMSMAQEDGVWHLPSAWKGGRSLPLRESSVTTTDARGEFSLAVEPGDRRLLVIAAAAPPWLSDPREVVTGHDERWAIQLSGAGSLDVVVDPDGTREGRDETYTATLLGVGEPLVGERRAWASTSEQATFSGVTPGDYTLEVMRQLTATVFETVHAQPVVIAEGETTRVVWSPESTSSGREVFGHVVLTDDAPYLATLVDPKAMEPLGGTVTVDEEGNFSLMTTHRGSAVAMVMGMPTDGSQRLCFAPIDLGVPGRLPTLQFDPTKTRLTLDAPIGTRTVQLVSTSGQPDLDRVISKTCSGIFLRNGHATLMGLPTGPYEAFAGDDPDAPGVAFTIPVRGDVAVTLR